MQLLRRRIQSVRRTLRTRQTFLKDHELAAQLLQGLGAFGMHSRDEQDRAIDSGLIEGPKVGRAGDVHMSVSVDDHERLCSAGAAAQPGQALSGTVSNGGKSGDTPVKLSKRVGVAFERGVAGPEFSRSSFVAVEQRAGVTHSQSVGQKLFDLAHSRHTGLVELSVAVARTRGSEKPAVLVVSNGASARSASSRKLSDSHGLNMPTILQP
jgi:hypothetical protein